MAFLHTGPEVQRFVELPDGRVLFLPRGGGGPVYVLPDGFARVRLERRYKVIDRVAGLAAGLGVFVLSHLKMWTAIPLLLGFAVLLPRWVSRTLVESLPEAHDAAVLRASRAAVAPRPTSGSIPAVVTGIAFVTWGVYVIQHAGELTAHGVATIALGVSILIVDALGSGNQDAMDHSYAGKEPENRAIEPRWRG